MIGTDGLCSVYDPPVSYWCSEHPSGGGAFAFRTPSGVTPKKGVLPNTPYKDASDVSGGLFLDPTLHAGDGSAPTPGPPLLQPLPISPP